MQSADRSLSVSLVNHLLGNNNVTVTLQWPREAGVVYRIDVLPETSLTKSCIIMSHNTITINLTISYNIQYNVSIVSSLCGVTIPKVLNYGKYKNNIASMHYKHNIIIIVMLNIHYYIIDNHCLHIRVNI